MIKGTIIFFTIIIIIVAVALPIYLFTIIDSMEEETEIQTNTNKEPQTNTQKEKVNYQVTFHSTWTSQTHPTEYPSSPHFSPLVISSHNAQGTMFKEGQTATKGIETIAETGIPVKPLVDEIKKRQQQNQVLDYKTGNTIFIKSTPSMKTITIQLSQEYPLITAVTMIAPSPDWFVGIESLNLYQNNQWVDNMLVNATTYDAGTDSGTTFTSSDEDTNPKEKITQITTPPLAVNGKTKPLGYFEIERIN